MKPAMPSLKPLLALALPLFLPLSSHAQAEQAAQTTLQAPEWLSIINTQAPNLAALAASPSWQQAAQILTQMGQSQGLMLLQQAQQMVSTDPQKAAIALIGIYTTLGTGKTATPQDINTLTTPINALLAHLPS